MNKPYFTQQHVALLNKWQGKKSVKDDPQQEKDYDELKTAYNIVNDWAETVQKRLFPQGHVKIRRSPVNQGGNFFSYLWAKIYPAASAPKELAYTVHIASDRFGVKIDTVNASKPLRDSYEGIRDSYEQSGIVASLTPSEALAMSFSELVDWTVEAINRFELSYAQVASGLNLVDFEEDTLKGVPVDELSASPSTTDVATNQILYGPPGTGKTYHTIEAAVLAAEPIFTWDNRDALKAEYERLIAEKRIRFVTFHQSYGYEEFVEGLSASATADNQVSYGVKEGIFKAISNDAKRNSMDSQKDQASLDAEQRFELALGEFKLAVEDGEDKGFKLTDACAIVAIEDSGFRYGGDSWGSLPIMKFEDLRTLYLAGVTKRQEIKKNDSVSGLARQHASYFVRVLHELQQRMPKQLPETKQRHKQNYVLVIDEINRGNISKIFGELITLIEPSKRRGADEQLEVTLPHSGDRFSVPNNLHIIGTMNTADRSLAMMDTALRRRFDFQEMMPKPELLTGKVVSGVDLEKLLIALNKRIEILYDREHTLGHAFFINVTSFAVLVSVFKNKVIPLLEEYFFEDWDKIRLVLADNQKPDSLQFVIKEQQQPDDLATLFGKGHQLNRYGETITNYSLAADKAEVWQQPSAYIGIYQGVELASGDSNSDDSNEQDDNNAETGPKHAQYRF
ncbi:AAA family ATPase [uncultured Ferrimonas sp.]|uniref:McrB family protein n=1 Tax=uncultured Ferrimonas sp. TaxID=432640 RepID=UPI002601D59F|nr:AAA family ATPase [uncultured Ferrimonas sp.]